MDYLIRVGGDAAAEVILLDQGYLVAAEGGLPGSTGTENAGTRDQQIEFLSLEGVCGCLQITCSRSDGWRGRIHTL